MKRTKGWLGVGLLTIGAIAVGVLLGEAALRFFYPQQLGVWHQDRNGLALHWPGLVTYLPQFGITASFNSVGMRDREHAGRKPEGVFRVLVLGDSFMEALQVPFEKSLPSLVERALNERSGRRVEVVNASVSGWGTDDELQYLTRYGMQLKPDLILLVMTLHNDISDNLRQQFHTIRNGALVEQPPPGGSAFRYELLQLKAFLATRSHTYQLLLRARRAREVRDTASQLRSHVVELFMPSDTAQISRGLELTALLLERVQTLASSERSRVVVVLLPLVVQLSDERFAAFSRSASGSARDLEIDKPQRMMKRVGDRLRLTMIDLLPGFRDWTVRGGRALYLERDGHWNEEGHRLAADIVVHELIDRHVMSGEYADSRATFPRVHRTE